MRQLGSSNSEKKGFVAMEFFLMGKRNESFNVREATSVKLLIRIPKRAPALDQNPQKGTR